MPPLDLDALAIMLRANRGRLSQEDKGKLFDALDELAEARRTLQWQPIATAPKDQSVLVYFTNALGNGRTVKACHYSEKTLVMDEDYAEIGEFDEASGQSYAPAGWYEGHESDYPIVPMEVQPTHWMPLPAPPED